MLFDPGMFLLGMSIVVVAALILVIAAHLIDPIEEPYLPGKEDLVQHILRIWCEYDLDHSDLLWVVEPRDGACFSIDCSDLFHWGEADSEPITEDNVDMLEQLLSEHDPIFGEWVLRLWALIQRDRPPQAFRMHGAPTWFRNEVNTRWPVTK